MYVCLWPVTHPDLGCDSLISALTARKLLAKGCHGILAYVLDTKMKVPDFEDIPVVKDFPDVFLGNYQDFLLIGR